MLIPVNSIIVKSRIRSDLGDIEALAESFKRFGQISPIVVNRKNVLIAGGRRLQAAKLLGWQEIHAVILDAKEELEQVELEVEENRHRKDFNQEENIKAADKIYRLKNPSFFRRVLNAIIRFFKKLLGSL